MAQIEDPELIVDKVAFFFAGVKFSHLFSAVENDWQKSVILQLVAELFGWKEDMDIVVAREKSQLIIEKIGKYLEDNQDWLDFNKQ